MNRLHKSATGSFDVDPNHPISIAIKTSQKGMHPKLDSEPSPEELKAKVDKLRSLGEFKPPRVSTDRMQKKTSGGNGKIRKTKAHSPKSPKSMSSESLGNHFFPHSEDSVQSVRFATTAPPSIISPSSSQFAPSTTPHPPPLKREGTSKKLLNRSNTAAAFKNEAMEKSIAEANVKLDKERLRAMQQEMVCRKAQVDRTTFFKKVQAKRIMFSNPQMIKDDKKNRLECHARRIERVRVSSASRSVLLKAQYHDPVFSSDDDDDTAVLEQISASQLRPFSSFDSNVNRENDLSESIYDSRFNSKLSVPRYS
jgi:hypothetical protein